MILGIPSLTLVVAVVVVDVEYDVLLRFGFVEVFL